MAQQKRITAKSRKQKQNLFLEKLEQYATITHACRAARIPRRTVYNWIESDESFKVQYDRSTEIAIHLLEDEAKRRAFEGTKEPVYQGGKKVGSVTKYSDTLLIFLLKNLKKEVYRDTVRQEHTGQEGAPIETKATVISNVDYEKLPTEVLEAIIKARIKVQD